MLRSLVGSEMCIRDRSVPAEYYARCFCGSSFADGFPPPCRQGENGQHSPCLLYTSDAADDLLCVDLGGRRIIKKKTIEDKKTNEIVETKTNARYIN